MSARDAPAPPARPVVHFMPRLRPPDDAFTAVYEAVLARGAGADLDDLRDLVRTFEGRVVDLADAADRARWSAPADGIEAAVAALRARAPERAERHLRRGVRGFIAAG